MTPSIAIRRYTPEDIPVLFEAVRESIPEATRWMSWCTPEYSLDDTKQWIARRDQEWENGSDYPFAIVDSITGEYYGGCGINQVNRMHNFCNLGYWVRTPSANRGIVTAAVPLVAEFAFRELKMERVEIVMSVGNLASRRVAEKAGALYEATLRRRLRLHTEYNDAWMFSLVK